MVTRLKIKVNGKQPNQNNLCLGGKHSKTLHGT